MFKRRITKSVWTRRRIGGGVAALKGAPATRAVCRPFSNKTLTVQEHIVTSPFPPIVKGPYPPFYEFLTSHWKQPTNKNKNKNNNNKDKRHQQRHPKVVKSDKVAIIDGSTGMQRTFGDYWNTAASLAAALRHDMNVQAGDIVALYCPNHVDYLPIVLAASQCAAVVTPLNPLYTTREVEAVLQQSSAKVLVTHISKLDVALQAVRQCPTVQHVVVVTDDDDDDKDVGVPEGTVKLASLRNHPLAIYATDAIHDDKKESINKQTLFLPYSSGTTGLPKGVCLSHDNIIVNLLQLDVIEKENFLPHHKLISPLPFFHIYGLTVSLLYCAWKGQTIITNSGRFDLEHYCQMVQTHQPERSHLVPPIILGLAKHPIVDQYDLSSLQVIVSAAAPLDQELESIVKQRLGGGAGNNQGSSRQLITKQGWGMSELSPIGTYFQDDMARSGSVGPPVSNTQAKIVNEQGASLGPHQHGELLIRGPQVMGGYLDEPERTAECLDEASGWLSTGDVAWYDEDGYFYIADRVKELIKVRGYPVAPAELEALLLRHEAINDVAVIPRPDEASGELPRAYIVVKETAAVTEQDVYDWVKERVANYKRLDGGIVFTESIPKSASGKILRRILRDQLQEELSNISA